jgi:hypothetical protein
LANYFWNDEEGNNKIHLANWSSVCMRKEFGGMGIPDSPSTGLEPMPSRVLD